ncbi:MAG: rhomboid family intramembrane serine protease [Oscillospiraceae bacterium]|nr:rhomboid family intramembrane serine protease [Oscillospiraceae bacterium]
MIFKKISYNSPAVLTFAGLSLLALILGKITGDITTVKLFSVYRASLADPLTYPRFFLHVLGHASYSHFIGNILLVLVLGPQLEERYGSAPLIEAMAGTALISGLVQFIFFPGTALLGASGIVFMMIIMSSITGARKGTVPLTMILVFILYIGGEIIDGLFTKDNISQITHIIGGICGAVFGLLLTSSGRKHH